MRRISRNKSGFTLVEILVIAPLVVLLVGAVVSATIYAVNSAMRAQAKSQLQLDVLSALDRIEQDVLLSVGDSLSGSDANKLELSNLATSSNPLSSSRKLIKKSDCSVASGGLPAPDALRYTTTYARSSDGKTLTRKLNIGGGCSSSVNVWQKHNVEEKIITNAKDISLVATLDGANALNIALTATRKSGGRDISYTGYLYAKSANME